MSDAIVKGNRLHIGGLRLEFRLRRDAKLLTDGELKAWPTCAKCKKPVEAMEEYDNSHGLGNPAKVLVVRCHGLTDYVHLTHADVEAMARGSVSFGEAFRSFEQAFEAAAKTPLRFR